MLILQNAETRERIIRLFIDKHFSDIRYANNTSGRWINVPSPEKQRDTDYRLGFNIDAGYVHDFTISETWSFKDFVARYLDIHHSEAEGVIFDMAIKEKIISLNNMPRKKEVEPEVAPPTKHVKILPEISMPPHTLYVDMSNKNGILGAAVSYLEGRGITQELVDKFEIRYCIGGRDGGRIIFPIRDINGKIVMYQGRAISDDLTPKYLFSQNGNKKQVVYNLYNVPENQQIIICEGIFDVIAAHKAGYHAVATFGNSLSFFHHTKISIRKPSKLILAYDVDAAGVLGLVNASNLLDDYFVINYPNNIEDFGDANVDEIHSLVKNIVPWTSGTFLQFLLKAALLEREKKNVL